MATHVANVLSPVNDLVFYVATEILPRDPAFRSMSMIAGYADPVRAGWHGYIAWLSGTTGSTNVLPTGGISVRFAADQGGEQIWEWLACQAQNVIMNAPPHGVAQAFFGLYTMEIRMQVLSLLMASLHLKDISGLVGLEPLLPCRQATIEKALRSILRSDIVDMYESGGHHEQWLDRLVDDTLFVARAADPECLDRLIERVRKSARQRHGPLRGPNPLSRTHGSDHASSKSAWTPERRMDYFLRSLLVVGLSKRSIVRVSRKAAWLAEDSARFHR